MEFGKMHLLGEARPIEPVPYMFPACKYIYKVPYGRHVLVGVDLYCDTATDVRLTIGGVLICKETLRAGHTYFPWLFPLVCIQFHSMEFLSVDHVSIAVHFGDLTIGQGIWTIMMEPHFVQCGKSWLKCMEGMCGIPLDQPWQVGSFSEKSVRAANVIKYWAVPRLKWVAEWRKNMARTLAAIVMCPDPIFLSTDGRTCGSVLAAYIDDHHLGTCY